MPGLLVIQPYQYRNPRIAAQLPVEFLTDGGVLFGATRDISERGLLANFGEPVLPSTTGRLRFRAGHCVVELQAEVTHTDGFATGIVFTFSSEQERALVRAILQALTQNVNLPTQPSLDRMRD